MMVGAPTCPISTAYSLVSQDLGKLKYALDLMTPRLVFASDARAYSRALELARSRGIEIAAGDATARAARRDAVFGSGGDPDLRRGAGGARRDHAGRHRQVPAHLGLDRPSQGRDQHPSDAQLQSGRCTRRRWPSSRSEPPVLVDWVPWAHTFGSNSSFGLILHNGGSFYIDEGKPTPHGIGATVANLREIAPTIYFNVPKGFEALLPYLQADAELRRRFFSRLNMLFYAGAGLSRPTWDGYRELAIAELGHPIPFTTSLGSTETAPSALINVRPDADRPGIVGVPHRGVELKLVPNVGKMGGAPARPQHHAGLLAPARPHRGRFRRREVLQDRRRAAPRRARIISPPASNSTAASARISSSRREPGSASARCDWISSANSIPWVRDVAVAGHDRDDIGMLVFPDEAEARRLAPHLRAGDAFRRSARRSRRQTGVPRAPERAGGAVDGFLDPRRAARAAWPNRRRSISAR